MQTNVNIIKTKKPLRNSEHKVKRAKANKPERVMTKRNWS